MGPAGANWDFFPTLAPLGRGEAGWQFRENLGDHQCGSRSGIGLPLSPLHPCRQKPQPVAVGPHHAAPYS